MHRKSISQLVYNHLYHPTPIHDPRSKDPPDFRSHVARNLVPEVRQETKVFYGAEDCIEARYPGLDYAHPAHRMRLGRFKHHAFLFRAFDALRLTEEEILGLCTWEGTRSARENFEREENTRVYDTTGEEIAPWVQPGYAPVQLESLPAREQYCTRHYMAAPEVNGGNDHNGDGDIGDGDEDEGEEEIEVEVENEEGEEDDDDDIEESGDLQSVGFDLNQRLEAAREANARGTHVVMDPAFEQWLKDACGLDPLSTEFLRMGVPPPPITGTMGDQTLTPVPQPVTSTSVPNPAAAVAPAVPRTGTAM
ncbi:MAG: hypothetical protein M4579_006209 [Chaenotheca gracillima]|nr:MAG: hypothetical protein M4579_006209 [Chaenotheca gracillima]